MPRSFLRRNAVLLLFGLTALTAGCRDTPEGSARVVVIGGAPKLRDPAIGPLSPGDAVLVANMAQGLVRFDAAGNIVAGLAERWNVSDDGMSYIFRIGPAEWAGGGKITAKQVARLIKRALAPASRNSLKDALGAIDDVVAMTDRVIEIRLKAPRPNLLALLAQPQLAIIRGSAGTGPFKLAAEQPATRDALLLKRDVLVGEDEAERTEDVLLAGASAGHAVRAFAAGQSDLVLGGTFADLPEARRANLPRGRLRFDPAAGLFGLAPVRKGDVLDDPVIRRLLSEAIDRDMLVAAYAVPGLVARATVLQPGLEGIAAPVAPAWTATPLDQRRPALAADIAAKFPVGDKPILRLWLPPGPGADFLVRLLARDWGVLGFQVERAASPGSADLRLIDEVAPSFSPAWFLRSFRCEAARVCDAEADALLEAARAAQLPAQRNALLQQAAQRIDEAMLFIPLAAPVRWSLVSPRLRGFAGNRFARHTLTDLEQVPGRGE
ncbi:MAG: ABC transporter substrate-binding protein [Sphingomicrobium sp.]